MGAGKVGSDGMGMGVVNVELKAPGGVAARSGDLVWGDPSVVRGFCIADVPAMKNGAIGCAVDWMDGG